MAGKPRAARKLARYRAKRDFKKTAEPSGAGRLKAGGHAYLIQKHAARRLHYDFRLELDGVLKSWAVTRGPSLNPEDKRLAVHVEDHPLEYGKFEGIIPQGQYGGGTVMLWDQGSWEPIGDPHRSYAKGHLDFELHGKRLKGRWHLVRMHGSRRGDEKRQNWLLIKGRDDYADEDGDAATERYQKSVVSGRGMEGIAKKSGAVWQSKEAKAAPPTPRLKKNAIKPEPKSLKGIPHRPPPDFVAPQLATLVSAPPKGENWVHEIKFDGYRLLARIEKGRVQMITRANNDWTQKFKDLAGAMARLPTQSALIDGEVVHLSKDGTMSFHALQNALSTDEKKDLHYFAFDLLFLNGVDLRKQPLLERKAALEHLLRKAPKAIHYSQHFTEPGDEVLSHACHIALEGIVSKQADAAYSSGRSDAWLKSKCLHEQEVVIGGFTLQPKHPGTLGALLMGYYEKGDLLFAGKVGTGFTNAEARDLLKKLQALQQKPSPFKSVPTDSRRGALFIKPELVAHVNFTEWTGDGRMRHPSFQGLREDKPAREVVREKEKPPPKSSGKGARMPKSPSPKTSAKPGKESVAGITLSHPDKILWPDAGITKRDLALYYEKVAPLMLKEVAGRPISLVRCPEGQGSPCFFQRHRSEMLSPHVKPVKVQGEKQPYIMIENLQGLIALVQMGALEIHMWGARADDPEKPDRLVFDLDPAPDVPWSAVKKAAQEVRGNLKELKLTSFLKVTGGKGLHIVVPFKRGPSWEETKGFARLFAQAMEKAAPERFTTNIRKNIRTGKIFVDYLRNGKTASAIAPYSTRAKEGAPIALPLDWKELVRLKSGHDFTMKNAAARFKKNPWKDLGTYAGQRLPLPK